MQRWTPLSGALTPLALECVDVENTRYHKNIRYKPDWLL